MHKLALPLAALAVLSACSSEPDSADDTAVVAEETAVPTTPLPDASSAAAATEIPAAALGRWGLVPADCEPGRADAKGLMTVEPTRLRFYESVGTLAAIDEASATSLRARFDFTGEGMTWQREMTIDVEDGGQTLVRQEYGDDAAPAPFRYSKCS